MHTMGKDLDFVLIYRSITAAIELTDYGRSRLQQAREDIDAGKLATVVGEPKRLKRAWDVVFGGIGREKAVVRGIERLYSKQTMKGAYLSEFERVRLKALVMLSPALS